MITNREEGEGSEGKTRTRSLSGFILTEDQHPLMRGIHVRDNMEV